MRQTEIVRFDVEPEPITASDDEIRASLVDAPIPPLLASVAHLTGDLSIARDDLRPDLTRVLEPDAGYSPDQIAEARELAANALIRHRDSGNPKQPPLRAADLRWLVEFVNGSPIDDDAESLYEAELALDGADVRRPAWTVSEISPHTRVVVGIVGAGMSGIIAAHRLRQAGVEVVVFEKNDDVGGTWLENDYPGCRVDIQNHFYSYATAQTPDWPQYHSPQPVLLELLPSHASSVSVSVTASATRPRCWRAVGRDRVRLVRRDIDRRSRTGDAPARCARVARPGSSTGRRCPTSRGSTTSRAGRSTPRDGTEPSTSETNASA